MHLTTLVVEFFVGHRFFFFPPNACLGHQKSLNGKLIPTLPFCLSHIAEMIFLRGRMTKKMIANFYAMPC